MVPAALSMLPSGLVDAIVRRLLTVEPDPAAVLVTGSYAAGTASPESDLDLMGLYAGEPAVGYRTWFEERSGRPLHISAGATQLDRWLRKREEPADWSLGFPTEEAGLLLWSTDRARELLDDPPVVRRPAAEPELEDFVEGAEKVKRALQRGDLIGARWHAHDMAALAPRLLLRLNPERRVADRRDAIDAALNLPVAPVHFSADPAVCFGLRAADDAPFEVAALRLPIELLALLRERLADVDPQPWIAQYLADGTLERHLKM